MNYNLQQKMAIETINGPVLIIAGPGTGKTFTLVERVSHMIVDLDINPSEIMITTFTNKAANELLDRLSLKFQENNIVKDVNDMLLGNFHSIARRILDRYIDYTYLKRGFTNIDDVEQSYIIERHIKSFRDIKNYKNYISNSQYEVRNIIRIIKKIYEDGIIKDENETNQLYLFYFDVLTVYEQLMQAYNFIDFSGILYYTFLLLFENESIRTEIKSQINYIMIDEYQDTNIVQENIIDLILNENRNICVVGDDDQALYRFRGASVKNILRFDKKFPETQIINLMHNYRSEDSIIKFYSNYLNQLVKDEPSLEKYRHNKILFSDKISEESRVIKISAENESIWQEKIYKMIKELIRTKSINSLNEIAILFSSVNDARARKLVSYLKQKGIDIYIPKTATLLSQNEVLKLIGALYAIFKPSIDKEQIYRDRDAQAFLDNCYENFYKSRLKDDELDDFINRISKFLLSDNFELSLVDIIYRLIAYRPFIEYMKDEEKAKKISRFMELLETFSKVSRMFTINNKNIQYYQNEFFYNFIKFLKDKRISEFEEDTIIPDKDSISVMTIHASKGMEYPVVIMASLWDTVFDRYNDYFGNDLQKFSNKYNGITEFEPVEFENLLDYYRKNYTGFSRAKDLLVLAGIDSQFSPISKEYREIYDELDEKPIVEIGIESGEISDNTIKKIYSFTGDIVPYNKCPIEYYYKRVLKFKEEKTKALYYGSIVHESIEYLNNKLIDKQPINENEIKEITTEIARQKYRSGAIMIGPEDVNKAISEVLEYYNNIASIGNPIDSELNIFMAFEDYILQGNVDMIYEKDGKMHIMDFKTGTPPNEDGEHLSMQDYFEQINLYAYLYKETKNKEIASMSLYFTDLNSHRKIYKFEYNDEMNKEILDKIDRTIKNIETENYITDENCVDQNSVLRFFLNKLQENKLS